MQNGKAFGTYFVLASLLVLGGAYTAIMGLDVEIMSKTESIQNFVNNIEGSSDSKEKYSVELNKNEVKTNDNISVEAKIDKEDSLNASLLVKNIMNYGDKIEYLFTVKNLSKDYSVSLSNPKANITFALDDVSFNINDFEINTTLEKTTLDANESGILKVDVLLVKDLEKPLSINLDVSLKSNPIKMEKDINELFKED